MSENDQSDPKPMTVDERIELELSASRAIGDHATRVAARELNRVAHRMWREGIIAGLRVREDPHGEQSVTGEMTRRVYGLPADLRAVRPGWCSCRPERGSVCSPRRRPADCDAQIAAEQESESFSDVVLDSDDDEPSVSDQLAAVDFRSVQRERGR